MQRLFLNQIVLTQFVLWMINIIWCTYTTTCVFISIFNFYINYVEYRNISHYRDTVIYRDTIVSWPKYRDAYRIVRSFPILTPRKCRKKVSAPLSNTSNLRYHLQQNHPELYAKLQVKRTRLLWSNDYYLLLQCDNVSVSDVYILNDYVDAN